jgi:hypothetical protein
LVVLERLGATCRVVIAGVDKERSITVGRVVVAGVALERLGATCGVEVAGVAIECSITVGRVVVADGVSIERANTGSRVVVAGCDANAPAESDYDVSKLGNG